ncbi:right-handed parallel beta-helix repeat-containing protein [Geothrix sp. 21YS21S-2]|uniref:beta strand repeat-containing protein n=1 Tax=Geothrix sp. 21YS21S-2 TaxID=3068893 RepID=UPI0027B95BCE|nr:right-handed parallel beta-helix repeat-containing protein [Geothrix sp. 21YS21S-2]
MNGIGIQIRILGILAIGGISSYIACGGAGSPNPALSVTPSSLTLNLEYLDSNGNDTVGVSITAPGTVIPNLNWSVDNIPGGNEEVGVLSGTGASVTYIAPTLPGTHTITATSTADAKTTASANVRVFAPAMKVALSPQTATLAPGATAALTAAVTGTRHTSVKWQVDGVQGGNATTGTISGSGTTVTYSAPASPGTHTVSAISSVNPSVSDDAVVTVQATPGIVVGLVPASASLAVSDTLTLTSTVTGSTNAAVTWSVDGTAGGSATAGTIAGTGNTAVYTAPAAAGIHTITATSVADPKSSGTSAITVQAPVSVSLTPSSSSVPASATASITATVLNATNTAVTWSVDAVAGGNATVGTLTGTGNTVTYTAPATAGSHTVMATSAADPTKNAATVISVQAPVQVTLSPSTASVSSGATASMTATVTGSTTTTVTWAVDGIAGGNTTVGTISGTGNTVTYSAPTAAGTHTVTAKSTVDPTKAATSVVTVKAGVALTLAPGATTMATSATLSFTATVTGTTSTGVTWTVDSIAGGNATVGTITGTGNTVTYTAPGSGGTHTVTATSTADTTRSASTPVTVQSSVVVALTPASASVSSGATQLFTSTVTGTTNTGVVWAVDGISGGNATVGTVSGTGATATYTAPAAAGTHTLKATSSADPAKSSTSSITVLGPVTVVVNPTSATVATGATASITATATGGSTQTVTWKVDGVAGGNSTVGTLTGTGATVTYTAPALAGSHTVTATSVANTAVSASTTITVQAPVITVTLNPSGSATMSPSGSQSFTATVGGTTNSGVSWDVDGIAGGSAAVGTISGSGTTVSYIAPATTGTHTITATSAANTSVSASTTVTVQSSSAVTVSLAKIGTSYVRASGATIFTATVSGSSNTSVTWTVDGVANGSATAGTIATPVWNYKAIYNAPSSTGTHTVKATSVADPTKSASITLTVASTVIQLGNIVEGANVKNAPYSARGDGATDDTAAIMAAVNAVKGTGKSVVIPAGTYMINPTANSGAGIRLGSNMSLILESGAVLQAMSTSTLNYQVVAASGVQNVNIYGGTILGNNGNNTIPTPTTAENGNCIQISGSQNVVVEAVATSKCFCDGIYIAAQSDNISIINCSGTVCRRNGMSIVYATNILVSGGNYSNNTGSVEVSGQPIINGSGIDVEPNAGESVVNALFSRLTFANNATCGFTWGISLSNAPCKDIYIDGCTASGNDTGLVGEFTDGSGVTNNIITNSGSYGIYIHDSITHTFVLNNTVTGTGSGGDHAGIELYNDTGTVCDGNTSTGNYSFGILSATSTNPTITNNILTGNGTVGLRISGSTGVTSSGNVQ